MSRQSTHQHKPIQPHSEVEIPPPIRQITLIPDPARTLDHAHRSLPPRRPAQEQKGRYSSDESVVLRAVDGAHDARHDFQAPARDREAIEEDLLALVREAPVFDGIQPEMGFVLLERFAVAVAHVAGLGVVRHLGGGMFPDLRRGCRV